MGFLDSLFDVNSDGKVDSFDFMDDAALFAMMREDLEEEERARKADLWPDDDEDDEDEDDDDDDGEDDEDEDDEGF